MSNNTGLLKEPAGWPYYGVAVSYAFIGYGFGIAGLFSADPLINVAAA